MTISVVGKKKKNAEIVIEWVRESYYERWGMIRLKRVERVVRKRCLKGVGRSGEGGGCR